MKDVALTGSLAGGDADGLLPVFDAYGDRLHAYAAFLLDDAETAGDALLDALLVAAGAVGLLADPARLRPWLYALTRNECLRRRPGGQPRAADAAEAIELAGRHRMAPAEVAAVLGLPAEDPDGGRVPSWHPAEAGAVGGAAEGSVPPRLRAAVAAAAGPEGAERRARLTRRARPFEPDGFPVPLDRRRLSGAALAWSAAAVVLLALGMLVVLPVGGGDAVGAAPAGPVLAADPPAADETQPVPTLADSPFAVEIQRDPAAASSMARPPTAPDRGADRRPATSARRGPSPTPKALGSEGDRRPVAPTVLSVTWSPRPDPGCGDSWTADLRARPYGPGAEQLTGARATVAGAGGERTVALRQDGDEWRGQVPGLPTDRPLTLTVRARSADGSTVEASRLLSFSCR